MGFFDRFAEKASTFVAHAPFFAACVLMILIWAPSYFVIGNLDTWQLIINTATTIVTFLLVALLQNSQKRFENSVHKKLDTVLESLAQMSEVDSETAESVEGIEKEMEA